MGGGSFPNPQSLYFGSPPFIYTNPITPLSSLRRVYVINKEICVRTVCAHEELLRGKDGGYPQTGLIRIPIPFFPW